MREALVSFVLPFVLSGAATAAAVIFERHRSYWRGYRAGCDATAIHLGTLTASRLMAHGISPLIASGDCGCEMHGRVQKGAN